MYSRKAPTLKFDKEKNLKNNCYVLPNELITSVMNKLSGKEGNLLKLMVLFLGTKEGFKLSQAWVLDNTGLTERAYYKARQQLIDKGMIEYDSDKKELIIKTSNIV